MDKYQRYKHYIMSWQKSAVPDNIKSEFVTSDTGINFW